MLKQAVIIFASAVFLTVVAAAQDDGHFDASFNGGVVLTKQADGNGIAQSATDGSNIFGTIRLKFNDKHSLEFTLGHAKNSQIYQTSFDFHVVDSITEYSFAYRYNLFRKGKFEPFLLGGGGALRFSPNSTWVFLPQIDINGVTVPNNQQVNVGAGKQTEFAVLYGGGVDYTLPRFSRFALRLQYRGLVYSVPDFKVNSSSGGLINFFTGSRSNMAEPSLGLVFRF